MLILLLPLLVCFGLGPVLTHEMRQQSYLRSQEIIAVDNAGIVFGRSTERLVAKVDTRRREVKWLEKTHHQVHGKFPEQDAALEASLEALLQKDWLHWEACWWESFYEAKKEAEKLGVHIEFLGDQNFPWERHRCRWCGNYFDLRERPGRFPLRFQIRSRRGNGSITIRVGKRYRALSE